MTNLVSALRPLFLGAFLTLSFFGSANGQDYSANDGGTGLLYDDERILGDVNAPVTLVEYASFTCPHCAAFHTQILSNLKADYVEKGAVRIIYRDFPLDRVAFAGSLTAQCLPEEQFFSFVDQMYETQNTWIQRKEAGISNLAQVFGVDQAKFQECQGNKSAQLRVLERRQEAHDTLEISSTPTVFVNGRRMTGARTYEDYTSFIDGELANAGFEMPADAEPAQ